ncbi:MAG: integration host factor subunit alpha [Candidatus Marinimicrobia bacterium]|nr:integration host factor subunit alpha [Candidatus Neomarinimicrobiota bacterium]
MTKVEIVELVQRRAKFSKNMATEATEVVFELIRKNLERGEDVKLPGFGKFLVREKSARIGRNPKTGEEIEVSARRVVTFKPSQILRERVQKKVDNQS